MLPNMYTTLATKQTVSVWYHLQGLRMRQDALKAVSGRFKDLVEVFDTHFQVVFMGWFYTEKSRGKSDSKRGYLPRGGKFLCTPTLQQFHVQA